MRHAVEGHSCRNVLKKVRSIKAAGKVQSSQHRGRQGNSTRPEAARHIVDQFKGPAFEFAATDKLNDFLVVLAATVFEIIELVAWFSGVEKFSSNLRSRRRGNGSLYSTPRHLPF